MRRIRWVYGFFAMMLCLAPGTVLVARHARRTDVDWGRVEVVVAIAATGILVAMALRKPASDAYLDWSIKNRIVRPSPVFSLTLATWLLAGTAFGYAVGSWFVATQIEAQDPDSYLAKIVDYPLPVLFLFAGLAVLAAAGHDAWTFRTRHELPVLEAEGIAWVAPQEPKTRKQILRDRLSNWLTGTLVDAAFFAGAIVPRLLSDDDRPTGDEIGDGLNLVVAGPGVVSFALLVVLFVLAPTRPSAFDALRQPSSLAAIGIFGLGWVLDSNGQELAGGICAFVAVLTASATQLGIQERGSQPWLGFLYLAGNYVYGYLTAPDGSTVLPAGVTGWAIAVLAAVYTAREAHKHWRKTNRVVPMPVVMPQH